MEASIHLIQTLDDSDVVTADRDVTVAVVPSSSFHPPKEWKVDSIQFSGDFSREAAEHLNNYINDVTTPYQRKLMPQYILDVIRAWLKANGQEAAF